MERRFEALDACRGLCACMVVLFHFSPEFNWSFAGHPLIAHANMFVIFFFVLSGFVLSHACREGLEAGGSVGSFLIRRLGRVYPLHLATLGLALALGLGDILTPVAEFDAAMLVSEAPYDFPALI